MWFPKSITTNFLSLVIGVLTGTIVNLLTSEPDCFTLFIIALLVCLIFCANNLLKIRNMIDEDYNNRKKDSENIINENSSLSNDDQIQHLSDNEMWKVALKENENKKISFIVYTILFILFLSTSFCFQFRQNQTSVLEKEKAKMDLINQLKYLQKSMDQIYYQNDLKTAK